MRIPCRIVLVRPQIAANLGAVARVMRNLGYDDLVLVAPEADPADPRGRLLATHSEDILDRAWIVSELGEAVADCGLVAATSARTGGLFRDQSAGSPEQITARLVKSMHERSVALVFGPEDHGLTNAEIARCHYLIHIDTESEHPALNLAQAVALCLYALRRAWQGRLEEKVPPDAPASLQPLASFAEQEFMFECLREALAELHFLYGPKADALMHALRHLIGRAGPSPMEVKVLLGLARQIQWLCRQLKEPPS
jgi:tRNA/rRNA methyltransferase